MGTRGEERLKAITDAATEVVAERGYYGMTIQEVSDRVGITQAGLLKYVKNEERAADAGAASIRRFQRSRKTTFRANLRLRPNSGSFLLC